MYTKRQIHIHMLNVKRTKKLTTIGPYSLRLYRGIIINIYISKCQIYANYFIPHVLRLSAMRL